MTTRNDNKRSLGHRRALEVLATAALVSAIAMPSALRARAQSEAPDIGVLVLPERPSTRPAIAPLSETKSESEESASFASTPEESVGSSDQKRVIPVFYGDFRPASRQNIAEKPEQAPPQAEPLRIEQPMNEPSVAPRASSTLLAYDRTREIFRNLVPSATRFTTDYRTRPANCEIPLTLRGRGLRGRDLPIGREDAYRDQLPADFMPTDLVLIPAEYCYANQPIYLRREAAESVVRMIRDAERQGLTLRVVSGYRDYNHQQRLYRQNGGRRTVGRPGKSEHMLGTTVDFTSTERYLLKPAFANTPEGKWLARNAHRYGWKLTVVSGSRVIEPWHFRYFGSALGQAPSAKVASSSAVGRAVEDISKPVRATTGIIKKIFGK
jgi:hypothetical protein